MKPYFRRVLCTSVAKVFRLLDATPERRARLHGLYVITGAGLTGESLVAGVTAALRGGARIVQYRDKSAGPTERLAMARRLARLCREQGTLFIINDDVELALAVAADGVHLGRDDGEVVAARSRLGAGRIIGVSCYNEWPRAVAAQQAGADYVAFGAFFPSATKPGAVRADPELLRRAPVELTIPACAIGGITAENGRRLVEAGAAMLAVIEGVFGAADIERAARQLAGIFEQA